ncbi:MAG: hypothetical protein ACRD3M_15755 [Thermoanaerobaculia bacterium]
MPELHLLAQGRLPAPRVPTFSAVSLAIGIAYAVGLRRILRQGG